MKRKTSLARKNSAAFALFLAAIALPISSMRAHEDHDHGATPAADAVAGSATDPWKNAQASLKGIQAAAAARKHEPIHNEQEKLVIALKQIQEEGGGADKARLDGAIRNAITASEKVHVAADAKDFTKVDANLKTLEATMAMVENQLGKK